MSLPRSTSTRFPCMSSRGDALTCCRWRPCALHQTLLRRLDAPLSSYTLHCDAQRRAPSSRRIFPEMLYPSSLSQVCGMSDAGRLGDPKPPAESLNLTFRPAVYTDLAQLVAYRQECGWGEDRVRDHWGHRDFPLGIFEATLDGKVQDVGMGGWVLDHYGDTSRAKGWVELCGRLL